MKFIPKALKTSCVVTLVHHYEFINFTVLPRELSAEIMEAIRDPHYGERKVAIRHLIDPNNGGMSIQYHTEILEYLSRNDPQNPILRYYIPGTFLFNAYRMITQRGGVSASGIIYDATRDVIVEADYRHSHGGKKCYLDEDLPLPLIAQLEEEHVISNPIMVPISTIKPI